MLPRLTPLAKLTMPAILRPCLIDFALHSHPIALRADAKITSQIWGERVVPVG
jgi:hypothetical protein